MLNIDTYNPNYMLNIILLYKRDSLLPSLNTAELRLTKAQIDITNRTKTCYLSFLNVNATCFLCDVY